MTIMYQKDKLTNMYDYFKYQQCEQTKITWLHNFNDLLLQCFTGTCCNNRPLIPIAVLLLEKSYFSDCHPLKPIFVNATLNCKF